MEAYLSDMRHSKSCASKAKEKGNHALADQRALELRNVQSCCRSVK